MCMTYVLSTKLIRPWIDRHLVKLLIEYFLYVLVKMDPWQQEVDEQLLMDMIAEGDGQEENVAE